MKCLFSRSNGVFGGVMLLGISTLLACGDKGGGSVSGGGGPGVGNDPNPAQLSSDLVARELLVGSPWGVSFNSCWAASVEQSAPGQFVKVEFLNGNVFQVTSQSGHSAACFSIRSLHVDKVMIAQAGAEPARYLHGSLSVSCVGSCAPGSCQTVSYSDTGLLLTRTMISYQAANANCMINLNPPGTSLGPVLIPVVSPSSSPSAVPNPTIQISPVPAVLVSPLPAPATHTAGECTKLSQAVEVVTCQAAFAHNKQTCFGIDPNMSDPFNFCVGLAASSDINCQIIGNSALRATCGAAVKHTPASCNLLTNTGQPDQYTACYSISAADASTCSAITDADGRLSCELLATALK